MLRRDLECVVKIERASFPRPWTHEDFLDALSRRNVIGRVAELGGELVGFMIYELLPGRIHVLNLAVSPGARRQNIGSDLLNWIIDRLSFSRPQIVLEVRETNLDAQLFFRSSGLIWVQTLEGHFEDCDEDAYRFQLSFPSSGAF